MNIFSNILLILIIIIVSYQLYKSNISIPTLVEIERLIDVSIKDNLKRFDELFEEEEINEQEEKERADALIQAVTQPVINYLEDLGLAEKLDMLEGWANYTKMIPAEVGKAQKTVDRAMIDEMIQQDPLLSTAMDLGLVSKATVRKIAKNPLALDVLKQYVQPMMDNFMANQQQGNNPQGRGGYK